jgi:hypothetical protein
MVPAAKPPEPPKNKDQFQLLKLTHHFPQKGGSKTSFLSIIFTTKNAIILKVYGIYYVVK